jgi:hypothetical protein
MAPRIVEIAVKNTGAVPKPCFLIVAAGLFIVSDLKTKETKIPFPEKY